MNSEKLKSGLELAVEFSRNLPQLGAPPELLLQQAVIVNLTLGQKEQSLLEEKATFEQKPQEQ